jgi:DNA-binding NarL/FixJ family response regulator
VDNKIKIFVVEDQDIYRHGLVMILNKIKGVEVIAEAIDGIDFLQKIDFVKPDIIFMDIRMPRMNGIEATEKALMKFPDLKIMAISMFGEEEHLQKMITAGGCGFLLKNSSVKEIEKAIDLVLEGKNCYSDELLTYFTKKFLVLSAKEDDEILLTEREFEVLKYIAQGFDNEEISNAMCISRRTVEGHKTRMILKTGSKNIIDLLLYSIRKGLVKV